MLVCISTHMTHAADNDTTKNDAGEWVNRSFQFQRETWWWYWWYATQSQPAYMSDMDRMPAYPEGNADEQTWKERIQLTTDVLRKNFAKFGGVIPEGSAFLYDRNTGTLAAYTTRQCMSALENLHHKLDEKTPRRMLFKLHILEGEWSDFRPLVDKALSLEDHSPLLAEAHEKGSLIDHKQFETDPKEEVQLKSGDEHGSCIEVSIAPGLFPDFSALGAYVNMHTEDMIASNPDIHLKKALAYMSANIDTYVLADQTKLVYVWQVQNSANEHGRKKLRAAFLSGTFNRVLPEENKDAIVKLMQFTERQSKPGKIVPPVKRVVPADMEEHSLSYDLEFYAKEELADADADNATDLKLPHDKTYVFDSESIINKFRQIGLKFDEGASASFNPYTGKLDLINTTFDLDAIEAYSTGLVCRLPPEYRTYTLDLIEVDEPLVKDANPVKAWGEAQKWITDGRAMPVDTMMIQCDRYPISCTNVVMLDEFDETDTSKSDKDNRGILSGVKLDIDAVVQSSNDYQRTRIELLHFQDPRFNSIPAPETTGTYNQLKVTVPLVDGETRLIGVLKPTNKADKLHAVFLRMDVRWPTLTPR